MNAAGERSHMFNSGTYEGGRTDSDHAETNDHDLLSVPRGDARSAPGAACGSVWHLDELRVDCRG